MNVSGIKLACALAGLLAIAPVSGLRAQGVNPDGYVLSSGWLALGPFSTEYASTFLNNDFLLAFLAPSLIQYQTPQEGEEIDYDPAKARAILTAYQGPHGPGGRPLWRAFHSKNPSEDLDFQEDSSFVGGPLDRAMTYLATYFDYGGDEETKINLCLGSDDGIQVWLDTELVHNFNTDRDLKVCQDLVPLKIAPGHHRIVLGVWDSVQEWSGSLGFTTEEGQPITEGSDPTRWRFRGKSRPPGFSLPIAGFLRREITSSHNLRPCPALQGSGPFQVTIQAQQLPDGPDLPILKEIISGSLGPERVALGPGTSSAGEVSPLPIRLSPVGDFSGSQVFAEFPRCAAGNGAATYDDGGTPEDHADDSYTLSNVGSGLWSTGDNCTYLYNHLRGDFEFTARIKERKWVKDSRWGQCGLMARQDLTPRARYAMVGEYGEEPEDPNDFEVRPTHGGRDNYVVIVLAPFTHHDWLKLKRTGDRLEGFGAPSLRDGSAGTYVRLGEVCWAKAPAEALVGLFVSSGTGNCEVGPASVAFERVQLAGSRVSLPEPTPVGAEITWRNVPRAALREGLSYSLSLDPIGGHATFDGRAVDAAGASFPVFGEGEAIPQAPLQDHGPVVEFGFSHAHVVGASDGPDSADMPTPGKLVVQGGGTEFPFYQRPWFTPDRLFYAYRDIAGDFSARVTIAGRDLPKNAIWAVCGIMAREDCSLRSRYSFIQDVGDGPPTGTNFDGRTTPAPFPFPGQHANTLRLDRCGNVFKGYVLSEPDPQDPSKGTFGGKPGEWVSLGEEDWSADAPPSVLVGLAVTSNLNCELATITFDRWRLYPACGEPPPARFVRGDVDSDGAVDLTDAVRILDHLFLGGPPPECLDAADTDDDAELSLRARARATTRGRTAARIPRPATASTASGRAGSADESAGERCRSHPNSTTTTRPGPWTPTVRTFSMSAVRLGPVMRVR
jgi:hypothetical protein